MINFFPKRGEFEVEFDNDL
jgi:transcriptional adapter 2-alpha